MYEPSPDWSNRFKGSSALGIQLFILVVGSSLAWSNPLHSASWLDLTVLALCLFVLTVADFRLPQGELAPVALPVAAAGLIFSHQGYVLVMMAAILFAVHAPRASRGQGIDVLSSTIGPVAALALGVMVERAMEALARTSNTEIAGAIVVGVVVLAGTTFSALETCHRREQRVIPTVVGSLKLQRLFLLAEISVGVLAALLVKPMGLWSLLLAMLVLLVIRQSFALLVEVKASYKLTMEALAKAMEAQGGSADGHGTRVSRVAAEAARELRLPAACVEEIGYAALLHDLAVLQLSDTVTAAEDKAGVEQLFGNVDFLRPILPILRLFESPDLSERMAQDSGRLDAAYLIARVSAWDREAADAASSDAAVMSAIGRLLPESRVAAIERAAITARDRVRRVAC